jgi:glyoxylate reductase
LQPQSLFFTRCRRQSRVIPDDPFQVPDLEREECEDPRRNFAPDIKPVFCSRGASPPVIPRPPAAILDSMKILASRRYPGPALDELGDLEVRALAELDGERQDIEGLLVANEPVPLDLLPRLRVVANFGVGYDRIDVSACEQRGVVVTNTPGVLDAATADLAFALILATRRQVVEGDLYVRSGHWQGSWSEGQLAEELTGATLGIVGLGRIGSAVARRARGFDLRVLYAQRRRFDTDLGEYRELDTLFSEADIVTLHVPLTPETHGLIDAARLSLLHDGACLVNTARGEIVDEEALVSELVSGRIRGGLDVFANEPHVPPELLDLPNVVLTPHLGSATRQTREAMTRLAVDNLLAVERGDVPLTPVRAEVPRGTVRSGPGSD